MGSRFVNNLKSLKINWKSVRVIIKHFSSDYTWYLDITHFVHSDSVHVWNTQKHAGSYNISLIGY